MTQAQHNPAPRTRANWRPVVFTWLMVSLIWLGGVTVLRPPVGSQVDVNMFRIYLLAGPVVTAIVLNHSNSRTRPPATIIGWLAVVGNLVN
jgi:hypothetical protein